jgi:hypothetical protein
MSKLNFFTIILQMGRSHITPQLKKNKKKRSLLLQNSFHFFLAYNMSPIASVLILLP